MAHRLVYHSTLGLRVIKKKKTQHVNLGIVRQLYGGEIAGYLHSRVWCIVYGVWRMA